MRRYIGLALIGMLILAPVGVKAQDTLGSLIFELNLDQGQIDQIRWFFNQFAQKQANLPTAVDVALQHRAQIREVITSAPFNPVEAQQVSQQISAIAAQRMVNRLELRNQIFQVLNPQQRQQYIQMVQQSLEGLE
jgi:Spy/CpxP family protein refolding chaperone